MVNPRLIAGFITDDPDIFCEWVKTPEDAMQILGLQPGFTAQDLKAAFRNAAKKLHPDANTSDPTTEEKFKDVNNANDMLQKYLAGGQSAEIDSESEPESYPSGLKVGDRVFVKRSFWKREGQNYRGLGIVSWVGIIKDGPVNSPDGEVIMVYAPPSILQKIARLGVRSEILQSFEMFGVPVHLDDTNDSNIELIDY